MKQLSNYFLDEKDFTKKVEKVFYFAKKQNLFFDKSTIMKAEIIRMFIQMMNIDVDENELVTASLVYSLKRTEGPKEIQRIKREIYQDREFLEKLGFSKAFAKYSTQYIRIVGEERSKQSDILELVEQFGGLIMHREDRLAFNIGDALDVLENKNFAKKKNRYLDEFIFFVDVLEEIKLKGGLGIFSKLQSKMNSISKKDISSAMRIVYDLRTNMKNLILSENEELFEDDINYINLLKIAARKTIELFEYNKNRGRIKT